MLKVNGALLAHTPGQTVADLLLARFPDWRSVVVKVDGSLVARADYARMRLPDGATIEVIRMVSGG